MSGFPLTPLSDQEQLGQLAMSYREITDRAERQKIVNEYAQTLKRLIDSGWDEVPPPEDQLPDDDMPREFFAFVSRHAAP